MIAGLRRRVAVAFGVAPGVGLKSWLTALFVLPTSQVKPLPAALQRWLMPLQHATAIDLAVPAPRRLRQWFVALWWLSPEARQRLTPLSQVARALLTPLGWPLQLLERVLNHFDFAPLSARLETLATGSPLAGPLLGALGLVIAGLSVVLWATTPLSDTQQLGLFVAVWLFSMVVRRLPGRAATLLLAGLSVLATARYAWWRINNSLAFEGIGEWLFGGGLLLAEIYAWMILLLGFIQNAWPLNRKPAPLPADVSRWPTVDIFIPSYNEPLKVVKPTVLAATSLDWPRDKLRVWLLDDGHRDSFRQFAEAAGVRYLTRPDNAHAKAGNLNHALQYSDGEFIAIFDCDHIPVRSFLQTTLGWLLRDPKCALVQTPHHFFSPDPFERNLGTFRSMPNEGSLFYGLVQDGNDLWNAAFFCGSCAVIRRAPLESIGGIAVETVTEDAHTALKLHRRGWNSVYLSLTQAAGLATESLASHVAQRIRWARGMAQIFRIDNPLVGRGLSLFQRLCYANAMLHFFYGLPRLAFLTAPLAYLFFQLHIIHAAATTLAVYVLPHLVQAGLANSRVQGRFRRSFWAEAYESVLAWYIAIPTTLALISPHAGAFKVTAKGGLVEKPYFDLRIALPYLALVLLNTAGVAIAIPRLLYWNAFETGTVVMNLLWALANVVMMGTALGVAAETRQVRVAHRVPLRVPASLYLPDGRVLPCVTRDYSAGGIGVQTAGREPLLPGTHAHVGLRRGDSEATFPVTLSSVRGDQLGLQLDALTLDQERELIEYTFGRADAWLDWHDDAEDDRPLASLREVLKFGLSGYAKGLRALYSALRSRQPVTIG